MIAIVLQAREKATRRQGMQTTSNAEKRRVTDLLAVAAANGRFMKKFQEDEWQSNGCRVSVLCKQHRSRFSSILHSE
jgi:hypothetical protein